MFENNKINSMTETLKKALELNIPLNKGSIYLSIASYHIKLHLD
jgi:hypothetical protein